MVKVRELKVSNRVVEICLIQYYFIGVVMKIIVFAKQHMAVHACVLIKCPREEIKGVAK